MTTTSPFLKTVYDGWDSHQQALMRAVTPLTPEQLTWRLELNQSSVSVNELIAHVAGARLWWFYKMSAPGSAALARQIAPWATEKFDAGDISELRRWMEANIQWEETVIKTPGEPLKWLELSWQMIETTLSTWTVADLARTYRHIREGKLYAVTRQWTIWRVLSHDLHHGGQIALMLGLQGIDVPELGEKGGHLTPWSLAELDA
ncbi:MAG TPA: DinB family protein [Chloroflexia bacterium]|nr:DinB family protein [Chloroflexia bacterium]